MKTNFKKKLTLCLSILMIAALVITGTMAYFTDTEGTTNIMTIGNIDIVLNEQQRVDDAANQHKLEAFEQAMTLMPAAYAGASIPWADEAEWVVPGDSAWKVVADNGDVHDKFVTVTNTGTNEAYVRVIVAYEGDAINGKDIHVVHNDINSTDPAVSGEFAATDYIEDVTIDGTRYDLIVYTYAAPLQSGETTIPSLKQIYMDKTTTQEEAAKYGTTYDILVLSQAVQTASGFTGAVDALNSAFGEVNHATAIEWFTGASPVDVKSDAQLKAALTANERNIVVNLTDDVTYDVAAWATNGMGGEATETIVINGNGHTITFNQTNSDWNNIVTANGATLSIVNAKITNAGHNNGPWNRHDLNFACDVVLTNVTSDKAMAFKAGATLNNVTINDANTSDTYAIWIQPNGQTVSLNDCTIDMLDCKDGRGIKIDEQYVSAPEKVTLNVSNTKFLTEEKGAILVKSVAGAEINLENVDISGVQADPVYPVWVDEASAAYAPMVVVNGGTKIIEGGAKVVTTTTDADFKAAIKSDANAVAVNGATIDLSGTPNAGSKDVVVNNSTVNTTSKNYTGLQHSGNVTYNNVTFNGSTFLYGNKVVFNNCTFNLTTNYLWTYGAAEVEFNNCTFNTDGKAILVYAEGSVTGSVVTINGCTFNATKTAFTGAGDPCAAVEIDSSLIKGNYVVNFVGNNTFDADFNGAYRIKNAGATNVTVNE